MRIFMAIVGLIMPWLVEKSYRLGQKGGAAIRNKMDRENKE